jgi:Protein of unknown function (DUF669)
MSPIIKPDLTDADSFGPIEPGTYEAKIESVDYRTSGKGNPMIVPKFQITVDGKIRKRNAYLVISGEGAYGFSQLLRACHFDDLAKAYGDKSIPLADKPEFNTDDLVQQELNVVIDKQLYNGEMRDTIKNYLRK